MVYANPGRKTARLRKFLFWPTGPFHSLSCFITALRWKYTQCKAYDVITNASNFGTTPLNSQTKLIQKQKNSYDSVTKGVAKWKKKLRVCLGYQILLQLANKKHGCRSKPKQIKEMSFLKNRFLQPDRSRHHHFNATKESCKQLHMLFSSNTISLSTSSARRIRPWKLIRQTQS